MQVVVEDFGINMTITFMPDVNPEDKWMNASYEPQYAQPQANINPKPYINPKPQVVKPPTKPRHFNIQC